MRHYLQEAYEAGVLAWPHRGTAFQELYAWVKEWAVAKLAVPATYQLVFYSSATECWAQLAEGLGHLGSYHVYTGSFGERWAQHTQAIRPGAAVIAHPADFNADWSDFAWGNLAYHHPACRLWCLTPNETSNGSQLPTAAILAARNQLPSNALIACDVTSSLACINVPWEAADIWFASGQKGLGLPAGLAVMWLSARAVAAVQAAQHGRRYNSLLASLEQAARQQTVNTPNVLAIYLLNRVLQDRPPIQEMEAETYRRFEAINGSLASQVGLHHLVERPENRSPSVVAVSGGQKILHQLRAHLRTLGLESGVGYGPWRDNSLRFANFPAFPPERISALVAGLTSFVPT